MEVSVVVPVYGCPEALKPLHERLTKVLNEITKSYEIILVNDGCPKGSWKEIEDICNIDKKVVGVNLVRNFGQAHSTNAGLALAKGNYVVLMDCDLQDNPEAIKELYKTIKNGNEIVFVKRKHRKASLFSKLSSRLFYMIYNRYVEGDFDSDVANYCMVTKKVLTAYNGIRNNNKSFATTICWMGFKAEYIQVENDERYAGKSSYSLNRKIDLAIDMLTSQSNKPLKALLKTGVIIAMIGFLYLFVQIIIYFADKERIEGWMTIVGTILIMGGMIMFSLGGVGIYVGNIFTQTNEIPEYIISETLNYKEKAVSAKTKA